MTNEQFARKLMEIWKECDEERLDLVNKSRNESEKWRSEGDMYGWNFHQGVASGMVQASIVFDRIRRFLDQ
jgi:hypothetical protein